MDLAKAALVLLGDAVHRASDCIAPPPGFFCDDSVKDAIIDGKRPPLPTDDYSSVALSQMNSWLELGVVVLCVLGAIGLGIYYSRYNRLRRRNWTNHQMNMCIIPLTVAATFAVIYYLTR